MMKKMQLLRIVFCLVLISMNHAHALKNIEGIILGDIEKDDQFDPLDSVFDKRYQKSSTQDSAMVYKEQVLEYQGFYREGENLKNSCDSINSSIVYPTVNKKNEAIQSVIANLQYVGLDLTVRAIGKYAQTLNFSKEEYINLTENLINNFCSKNLSVYSLKLLKRNLLEKYFEENNFVLPNLDENPHYPEELKPKLASLDTKEKEMALTVKNFRAFCSWSGMSDDYRMLIRYLKNPFVMSYVFRHMQGVKVKWDSLSESLKVVSSAQTTQVLCENLICRKKPKKEFDKKFPYMVGSAGLGSDLKRLYCGLFKDVDFNYNTTSEVVKGWLNDQTFDEMVLEQLQISSLITSVPDLVIASSTYAELEDNLKANIKQKWDEWGTKVSSVFSKDILYEEGVEVNIQKKLANDPKVKRGELQVDFEVTQGEYDRSLKFFDKLKISFDMILPKSLLSWARKEWNKVTAANNTEKKEKFLELFVMYIEDQLDLQKKQFLIPPWSKGIEYVVGEEILSQILNVDQKRLNLNKKEKMKIIPVTFHYGLFAMKYFRYKFNKKYR